MSAQINLYHPRYLKQSDALALGPILAVTLGFYLLLALAAGWMWRDAAQRQATAAATDAQLKVSKALVAAAMQVAAAGKPNAQLRAEVENAEAQLRRRESIIRLLEGGAIGTRTGFSEHFRALARQAPEGLWLKGFSISAGGSDIRISGSTLYAAAVPDYIGRLGRETAFKGKSFAALTMQRPTASAASSGAGVAPAPTAAKPASSAASTPAVPPSIDFVLLPRAAAAPEVKP